MNNWKVGDRAIINFGPSYANGMQTTVTSELTCIHCDVEGTYMGHMVDIPDEYRPSEFLFFEPHELVPIPDSYDGLEISSWSECPTEFHPDNFKVTV